MDIHRLEGSMFDDDEIIVIATISRREIVAYPDLYTNFISWLRGVFNIPLKDTKPHIPYWYPSIGQVWHWEPMKSTATERIKVIDVNMNEDDEFWIGCVSANKLGWHSEVHWIPIGRWMEAAILIDPNE